MLNGVKHLVLSLRPLSYWHQILRCDSEWQTDWLYYFI